MKDQKFFGTILIIGFFFCVSMAWRASWKSARENNPLLDTADEVETLTLPKISTKPIFEAPKAALAIVKKQAAPAWGSFQVAGAPSAKAISLKQEFNGKADAKNPAKDPKSDKTKKVAKKKTTAEKKVAGIPATKPTSSSTSSDDKMKPLEDRSKVANAVMVLNNTPVAPAPVEPKKSASGRSAQEWEAYLTENTSQIKARTSEFISAYQTGQLASDEDAGLTPTWMYSLIQRLFDNNELAVQESGLRISKAVTTSESFAVVVKNASRVDNSLRADMKKEYETYKILKKVSHLNRAMFNGDHDVQIQALDILAVSANENLLAPRPTQNANGQASQSSTAAAEEVFEPFVTPLKTLAETDKDNDVRGRAFSLWQALNTRLNQPSQGVANNQTPFQPAQ